MAAHAACSEHRRAFSIRLLRQNNSCNTTFLSLLPKTMSSYSQATVDREITTQDSTDTNIGDVLTSENRGENEEEEEINECPLFMAGLPSDFSSNPHLMALASLIDGEDSTSDEEKSKTLSMSSHAKVLPRGTTGGGKVRSNHGRTQRRNIIASPYQPPTKAPTKSNATLGEAQLFLKMWKI